MRNRYKKLRQRTYYGLKPENTVGLVKENYEINAFNCKQVQKFNDLSLLLQNSTYVNVLTDF
jgi:hypothetical protein